MALHHKGRVGVFALAAAVVVGVFAIAAAVAVAAGTASVTTDAFTPEHGDKYHNSRVLYDADRWSVTIRERQFQGAVSGESDDLYWRQVSVEDFSGGMLRASYGPGEWVDNRYLSPWYVYRAERPRTYLSDAAVWYHFQYYECLTVTDDRFPGITRGTSCGCWMIGTRDRPVRHEVTREMAGS